MSPHPATVHVVFKTHLDIGFTDFAATVVRQYRESFIPRAISVANELRARGGERRFVWTTGSWLIHDYLEHATPAARAAMEAAILAGDIRWHALPFTTHSEAATPALFRAGLALSGELDRRFGIRTVAAKMTDVPGHTRGVVPLLAEAGVEFLHLGVNAASPAPDVPDLFRWRDPESGAELTVMYHKSGYGGAMAVEGIDDALYIAHTADNYGPQSADQLIETYATLQGHFPQARLVASTLDHFAIALRPATASLPVVEGELGDTWIHGLGTDPAKVSGFRELCRQLNAWEAEGKAEAAAPFARKLLLVAEHTWGMDVKKHLGDYVNYRREDFASARQRDVVDAPVPEGLEFTRQLLADGERRYSQLEASWREQRDYLDQAIDALGDSDLAREARARLAETAPRIPDTTEVHWFDDLSPAAGLSDLHTRHFGFGIDAKTGALNRLVEKAGGREWAGAGNPLGLIGYQTFSADDCDRYLATYNVNLDDPSCSIWAIPDFGKPGLSAEDAPLAMHPPLVRRIGWRRAADAFHLVAELGFAASAHERYGAPARVWLDYAFPEDAAEIRLRAQWFDKPANRMPEALWCSFQPVVQAPDNWRLHKLGRWVSPLDVARNGNRNLHGVETGIRYAGPDGSLSIETLDAALVAPGRPRLLEYDHSQPPMADGMHVNLYNNIWGTNFPMWYENDALFRFILRPSSAGV